MILTMRQVEYLKRCSFQYQTSGLFQANFDLDAYVRTFVIKEFQEALHLSRDEELLDAGDLVREVTELEAQRWSIWTYKWQPEYRAYIEPMKEHWMLKELVPNLKILIEPPRFLPGMMTSKDYVVPVQQVVSLSGWNTDEGAWHYAA